MLSELIVQTVFKHKSKTNVLQFRNNKNSKIISNKNFEDAKLKSYLSLLGVCDHTVWSKFQTHKLKKWNRYQNYEI